MSDDRKITKEAGLKLANEVTAVFQETSAFIDFGVDEAFEQLVEAWDKGNYAFGRGNVGEGKNFDKKRRKNGESLVGASKGLGPAKKKGERLNGKSDQKDGNKANGNKRICC